MIDSPPDTPVRDGPGAASARFGSGRSVQRVEDDALLTGRGRFADDVAAPGEAVVVFLRSPHAHAAIASIDTRAAAALPGVVAIVTGADLERDGVKPLPRSADFKRADGKPSASPPQRALATDVVRHVGEPVAAIVATSLDAARDAAEAIDVRYEPRSAVAAVDDAIAPGAAQVWPGAAGNVACVARHGDAKAVAAAFARAKHVVGLDLVNQRVIPAPVEPRTTLADALRDKLRLTGTHLGCEHGVCGACTVRLDGVSVRGCCILAVQVDGSVVETVESLAGDDLLSPLQAAFKRHHALQCGFCTPGILIAADDLLSRGSPSHEEIVDMLSGQLCRCTGYAPIVAAIEEARDELPQARGDGS